MLKPRNISRLEAILFLAIAPHSAEALQSVALDAAAAFMLAQTRQAALYFRAPEALEHLSTTDVSRRVGGMMGGKMGGHCNDKTYQNVQSACSFCRDTWHHVACDRP